MDDTFKRNMILQVVLGDNEWSGSGFIINDIGSVQYIITTTSWMKNVLNIAFKDSSIHFDFVKDSVAFVYWQSIKERTLHKTRVSRATVCYLQDIHYILKQLENNSLNDWSCNNTVVGDGDDELLYLSCVALFAVENIDNLSLLSSIGYYDTTSLSVGQDIYISSTPFGSLYPQIFYNSLSRGCVSNVYGTNNEVFLTDARCVPGSEGGMVLIKNTQTTYNIIGIVITNLVDNNNIPINASLGISFSTLKQHITNNSLIQDLSLTNSISKLSTTVSSLSQLVLPVSFGSSIGSGIVISNHLILTCAHVVRMSLSGIVGYRGQSLLSTVIYCAPKDSCCPDIAILSVKEVISLSVMNILEQYNKCSVSDRVASIGYTYQNPFTMGANPIVSNGIISKIVPNNQYPVMIQTTSCVYHGMSGGLLYNNETQSPLGLLTCIARDEMSSFSYSNLSFAIPFSWIRSSIKEFIISRKLEVFSQLKDVEMWNFTGNTKLLCSKM